MSDRTQKQATAKAAWATFSTDTCLADMLASVCSYCVMVKSVSCCCVHGSRVLSNPVTNLSFQQLCTFVHFTKLPIGQYMNADITVHIYRINQPQLEHTHSVLTMYICITHRIFIRCRILELTTQNYPSACNI